jgi:hypothetical protein
LAKLKIIKNDIKEMTPDMKMSYSNKKINISGATSATVALIRKKSPIINIPVKPILPDVYQGIFLYCASIRKKPKKRIRFVIVRIRDCIFLSEIKNMTPLNKNQLRYAITAASATSKILIPNFFPATSKIPNDVINGSQNIHF